MTLKGTFVLFGCTLVSWVFLLLWGLVGVCFFSKNNKLED